MWGFFEPSYVIRISIMGNNHVDDSMLDVRELSRLLNCSERHARQMILRGCVPGVIRLGRSIRLDRKTIMDWISQGCPVADLLKSVEVTDE
jgi:excisionase family DNA binding protein